MERSIFGVFTAFLCALCIICTFAAMRKKRYGLALFCLLNAVTNIVNSIHAFYGTLF